MEFNPTVLSVILVLVFSTVTVGIYLISDYYMDNGFPSVFGQVCDKEIQDDCAYVNSHLNTFGLSDYDDGNDCALVLNAGKQPGARYKLKWKIFELEGSNNCTKDYLELHQRDTDGLVLNETSRRFCGNQDPQYNITQQYVVLKFVSDGQDEDKGFRVMATRTLPAPCSDDYYHCKAENRCIDGRLNCDGTPQCDDESDEQECTGRGTYLRRICSPCAKLINKGKIEPKDVTSVHGVPKEDVEPKAKEQTQSTEDGVDDGGKNLTKTKEELISNTTDD